MYQNYKVVICTPAGRQKYLSIFKNYIYRKMNAGIVDEWQLWQNTTNPSDIAYLESMAAENPKVKICKIDEPITIQSQPSWNSLQTHKFMKFAQDDDAIYIRFDDDIVFIEDNFIEKVAQARIDNPNAFIIYPNIINSTICTSWHQEIGALSEEHGIVRRERPDDPDYAYLDEFCYSDSGLIDHIHKTFKKRYEEGSLSAYYLPSRLFTDYKHFSICSICWWGRDKIDCGYVEEPQMAWELPMRYDRPVWFAGNALCVHFTYHTQKLFIETTNHLDFYREISK